MTHEEAVEAMSCMRDFSGMRKVIKRIGNSAVDFGDNCWYVDYVENSPMSTSSGRIISTSREGCLGEGLIYPRYQVRTLEEKEREEQTYSEPGIAIMPETISPLQYHKPVIANEATIVIDSFTEDHSSIVLEAIVKDTKKTMQHYLGDYSGTAMTIRERKLAGTPPMGRSKEQHTLIQKLNKKR